MKWLKPLFSITLLVVFGLSPKVQAQDKLRETFEKSYQAGGLTTLSLDAYDSDIKINTWDSPSVKISGVLILTDEKYEKDDMDALLEAFRNPDVENRGKTLFINTRFVKSSVTIAGLKKTTTLSNGKTIKNISFRTSYEIWMPASLSLNLGSKYNKVEVASLSAPVHFDLYNVRLTMGTFADGSSVKLKYSKASMGAGGSVSFDIYDSDLVGESLGNVELVSKYSSYKFTSFGDLEIDSYDDDIEFTSAASLKGSAKYGSLKAGGNIGFTNLKLYDTDVTAQQITTLQLDVKYAKLKADKVVSLVVSNSYDSQVEIGRLKSVTCLGSKYDKYSFGEVAEAIAFTDAYSSEIRVASVGKAFGTFKGQFRYGQVELGLPSSLDYRLSYQITYGKVNFDKGRFKHVSVSETGSSKSTFNGSTSEGAACSVSFTAYDTRFDLGL